MTTRLSVRSVLLYGPLLALSLSCAGEHESGPGRPPFPTRPADGGSPNQIIALLTPGADPASYAAQYGLTIITVAPGNLVLYEGDVPLPLLLTDARTRAVQTNEAAILGGPINLLMGFTEAGWVEDDYPDQSAFDCLDLDFVHQRARGDGVRVGLIDTGIAKSHPHLFGRTEIISNAVLGSPYEIPNPSPDFGHGTHVAGTILTVAPEATIVPFKVLNSQGVITSFAVAVALNACLDAQVDIINMSLRLSGESAVVQAMIERVHDAGIPIIVAAGNDLPDHQPGYPASDPNVVAVAATALDVPQPPGSAPTTCAVMAGFSAYDDAIVEYAAIGDQVTSSYPGPAGVHRLATASGTSTACAVVTGLHALVLGACTPPLPEPDPLDHLKDGFVEMPGYVVFGRISPADIFD